MPGRIVYAHRYTRAEIQANRDVLYVFGDNLLHRGFAGQASQARGEPNAVGIPTKWAPTTKPTGYFHDGNLEIAAREIDDAFRHLWRHLKDGGTIVLPADGLGTGLADLPRRAPAIHRHILWRIEQLKELSEK